jgi:hypothetical protein
MIYLILKSREPKHNAAVLSVGQTILAAVCWSKLFDALEK